MKDAVYLVFDKKRVIEMRRGVPHLRPGHYAVRVQLEVPDKAFKPDGFPVATLVLEERHIKSPPVVAEVTAVDP